MTRKRFKIKLEFFLNVEDIDPEKLREHLESPSLFQREEKSKSERIRKALYQTCLFEVLMADKSALAAFARNRLLYMIEANIRDLTYPYLHIYRDGASDREILAKVIPAIKQKEAREYFEEVLEEGLPDYSTVHVYDAFKLSLNGLSISNINDDDTCS